jgi:DnaK suppressor protein
MATKGKKAATRKSSSTKTKASRAGKSARKKVVKAKPVAKSKAKAAAAKSKKTAIKKAKPARKVSAAKKPARPAKSVKAKPKSAVVKKISKAPAKLPRPTRAVASLPILGNKVVVLKTKTRPRSTADLGVMSIPPYQEKRGEGYMSDKQRAHFRHILHSWKRELMEEVDRTVHHMQDEAANFPDPNDRATQEEEFSLELRTRDRERKLIKKIDEALQKIEHDEYGYCDACGIDIGIRRLEARPTANLCIDCKILDEIKERQMGGV